MAIEIERKFLLADDGWRSIADNGTRLVQGYLLGAKQASVRVRIEGKQAFLNIKSATIGTRRQEYEYAIPMQEAEDMLTSLCEKPLIDKIRYNVYHQGQHWEIDVFSGDNTGLLVAEIELEDEQQAVILPRWIGEEVSHDPRYYNVNLVKHPYSIWQNK